MHQRLGRAVSALALTLLAASANATTSGLDTAGSATVLPLAVSGNTVLQLNADLSSSFNGPVTVAPVGGNESVSINQNQIWKSNTTGGGALFLQYSAPGMPVVVGGATGSSNNLYVMGQEGINTETPQATLDVQGEIRAQSSGAGCSSTNAGAMRYNSTSTKMEYCNGTAWTSMGGSNATFNNGVASFDGGASGAYVNNKGAPMAVNIICPNHVHDNQLIIYVNGLMEWYSGGYVGSGYTTAQSGQVIVPDGASFNFTSSGFNGTVDCIVDERW